MPKRKQVDSRSPRKLQRSSSPVGSQIVRLVSRRQAKFFLFAVATCLGCAANNVHADHQSRPTPEKVSPKARDRAPGQDRLGMVAADHRLASAVGVELLKSGGNAVDAACAAAFALSVVNPAGSGIGGGGFMLIKKSDATQASVLDFREVAPANATAKMYLAKGVKPNASRAGALAVAVPGEVLGCAEAVKRFGKKSLKDVLKPAIRFAENGFAVGPHLGRTLLYLQAKNRFNDDLKTIFFNGERPYRTGELLKRPRLAKTLRAIASEGAAAFYKGWIAKDIVDTLQAKGGILTLGDLANYRVKERKPLATNFNGHTIYTMPPPSSGGVAIIESLNILRTLSLKGVKHNSATYIHLLSEALKHAFADRARHLADADFVDVPVGKLVGRAYAAQLAKRVGPSVLKDIKSYGSEGPPKAPTRDSGTSHLSVVDRWGMMVAMTTTINTAFGSLVVGKKSGVILNNEMDDFTANPGKPNAFGLTQSEKNLIAPGKKPLSSMSPTIVCRDGKPILAVGGSGGPTIISGTLQVILNVIHFGFGATKAVSSPRVHHQWLPNKLWVEANFTDDTKQALEKKGHAIKEVLRSFTAVQAVVVGDRYYGASDPRKQGQALGY
jgi:gamma-glutamyltranspeptidase / glutathione hydrolase